MKDDILFKRKNDIHWQVVNQQVIILNSNDRISHDLNESASLLWTNLIDKQSFDDLYIILKNKYEADSQILKNDLQEILDYMLKINIIETE